MPILIPTTDERAAALLAIATESQRTTRELEIVERTEHLRRAGVPERTLLAATANRQALAKTEALTVAESWSKRRAGTLVLSGPIGTGKTIAACRYALVARAQWVTAASLGLATHMTARAEIDRLVAPQHLVLDELGGHGSTSPVAVERIAALLSFRHANLRHTVVTTNLDREAFARVYEGVDDPRQGRLLDRIREDGRWLIVGGQSFRGDPIALGQARVDMARRFLALVHVAEAAARGEDVRPDHLDELARMLGADETRIAEAARRCRDEQARSMALVDELLQRMADDGRIGGGE